MANPIKGEHSSRRKGDNGTVSPKAAPGQTTAMKDGPFADNAAFPDASGVASSNSA